ncbi:unnamed protein product [Penicillium pancosmium]
MADQLKDRVEMAEDVETGIAKEEQGMTCNESALSMNVACEKALVWKQDLRVVPLSAFIYLLCYLDRSNIGEFSWNTSCSTGAHPLISTKGNAKTLNADTGNDLVTETKITNFEYTYASYECAIFISAGANDATGLP